MKYLKTKTILSIVTLIIFTPMLSMAQPAGPGDGSDPFAAPVNDGVAFVASVAFLFGAYRIYHLTKKNSAENNNR